MASPAGALSSGWARRLYLAIIAAMSVVRTLPNSFVWPEKEIENFCRRWKIVELAVFGSILREDFRPDSDIDFLARFCC